MIAGALGFRDINSWRRGSGIRGDIASQYTNIEGLAFYNRADKLDIVIKNG
jgi:hypothetical protein